MRVLVSKDFVITNTPGFGSSVMINGISVEDEDAYSYRSSGYSPCKKFIVLGGGKSKRFVLWPPDQPS